MVFQSESNLNQDVKNEERAVCKMREKHGKDRAVVLRRQSGKHFNAF
jgi:hypothetical protein